MVMNSVNTNYVKTEVGIIPEDWRVATFNELFQFLPTGTNARSDLAADEGDLNYVHYGDIHKKWDLVLDCDVAKIPFISREKIGNLPLLEEGDLLIADASEDYAGIGTSVEVRNIKDKKIVSGLHTILLRGDKEKIADGYKAYLTSISAVKHALISKATGISVYGISKNTIKNTKIPLPVDLREQSAIVRILSDTHNLIKSLNKLIEKKKNIKQGAIQELLTGKKRLPEFRDKSEIKRFENLTEKDAISENWEVVQLKDITSQIIVPMRDKPKFFKGTIPWCRIEDFEGKYLSNSKSGRYVDKEIVNNMNLKIFPADTLLVSCSADLGRCAIVKKPLVTNQTFIGLVIDDSKADNEFLYYYMTFHAEELNNLSSGTTISYLSREQFENLDVRVPRSKIEQSAIAQVLSNMDIEIEKLEQKKEKYKQLETGLKQQLLTGRIRLQWKS